MDGRIEAIALLLFSAGILLTLMEGLGDSCLRRGREYREKFRRRSRISKKKINREVYESLSFLRNLIIINQGNINSDGIISMLADRQGPLREAYLRAINLLRIGRVREAEDCLGEHCGQEYARLLIQWEQMNPMDLEEILIAQRIALEEAMVTEAKRRDEILSDFIYFPAIATVFIIFFNFVYISYFMEQKAMLGMIFNF